jgi:hypothetical protein
MHDHFEELYEWDHGVPRKKKQRVLPDGARAHFTMQMMDHASFGFRRRFADGSVDHTDPHRPGYRFSDVDDADRLAAERAYAERLQRRDYRTRQQTHDQVADRSAPHTRSLDELRDAADAAYEARRQRMHYTSRYNRA